MIPADISAALQGIESVTNNPSAAPLQGKEIDPTHAAEFAKQVNGLPEISQIAKTLQESSTIHQTTIGKIDQNFAAAASSTSGAMNRTEILDNQNLLNGISKTTLMPSLNDAEKSKIDPPILRILQETSDKYQANIGQVKQNLATALSEDGEMSGTKILENQMLLAEASALAAYFSKVAGSLTNAVNTIVKTQ